MLQRVFDSAYTHGGFDPDTIPFTINGHGFTINGHHAVQVDRSGEATGTKSDNVDKQAFKSDLGTRENKGSGISR